jgi:hypothetical protein
VLDGKKVFSPLKNICRRVDGVLSPKETGHLQRQEAKRASVGLRLPQDISRPLNRTFRSRAKLPWPSPAPPGPRKCRVRASLRCRGQLELGPQPREHRLRAKASSLSCAGCEMTMARRFSFCLDLYPCFCGSFFLSARQQRASLRTDC